MLADDISDPEQVADDHGKAHGAQKHHVYRRAFRGYSATLPAAAADAIRNRREVLSVTEDGVVRGHAVQPAQAPSFGVLRIDADESSTRSGNGRGTVSINVAVLDDGGPVPHVDLNVAGSTSCVKGAAASRPSAAFGYHGTMVGGFIGAVDNAIGRVGIAPGARLWAVRVLDENGLGNTSEIICGLDWVTATRTDADPGNDIQVANMSLSGEVSKGFETGSCADSPHSPPHRAICTAVAAGVTIVASAGNDGEDLQQHWPATFAEVLAVTAIGDFDGQPGGLKAPSEACLSGLQVEAAVDDDAAFFSNFAVSPDDERHTVAAPGVCISSTYPGDLYATGSGTSYSAPLASGTVALCIAAGRCAGLTPQQIIAKIAADAGAYNTARKNQGYGFTGDPLRPIPGMYYGYLIRAGLY